MDSERVTLVNAEQLWYVDIIDYQLFVVNTIEKWMCFLLANGRKLRFSIFDLIFREDVSFGVQNEGNDTIRRMSVKL